MPATCNPGSQSFDVVYAKDDLAAGWTPLEPATDGSKPSCTNGVLSFETSHFSLFPGKTGAPDPFGLVDTKALFRFTERGWECVEYRQHLKIGKMHFTHDVGHAGIYAHRQSRMAYEGNVVIGHCHRLAMEVAGTSKGPAHVGIMLGWLGDKGAIDYMHAAKASQWTLGFGVAYHERDTGNVHVTPVPIVDYRCVVEGVIVDPLKGTSADKRVA
jgi:hypothetical protein